MDKMKTIITGIIIAVTILESFANPIQAQTNYKSATEIGISNVLGYEPEEFIKDTPHVTSNGIVNTDFMYGNGQHAYFDNNNIYFIGDKTSVDMKFELFSNDERNTMLANNSYGIIIDTTNKVIKDLEEDVLANFTDYISLIEQMEQITNEIVEEDINVTLIGIIENNENKKAIYMVNNNLQIDANGKYNIIISDIAGKQVTTQYGNEKTTINFDNMANGTYIVTLFKDKEKITEKIVKN